MRRAWGALAVGALLVVASCGDAATDAGSITTSTTSDPSELPFGLTRCPAEVESISAAPEHYRDQPVYVGNEMPTEAIQAWAQDQPAYEGIWIDWSHNGWVTVAFSEDADQRQAELEAEFPEVGVVAVAVDWTEEELNELRHDAVAALADVGVDAGHGILVSSGTVSLMVGELSEERLAPLAPFAGPRLCVEGIESADVVREGPQPNEGDGWRLLASDRSGATYRTGIATNDEQYIALWEASGVGGDPADVDFEHEVVIWFGAVYGSSCDIRMDDVVVDREHHLVHALIVTPGSPMVCTSDARPKAYVVAVERSSLPEGPLAIQLRAEDPHQGAPEERTLVAVDLSAPGAEAADDEIGPDPELVGRVEEQESITAGGRIETGYPVPYDLDLSCSFDILGPFNGATWQAVTPDLVADPPAAWASAAADGVVRVDLLIEPSPARLSLSVNSHTERYEPVRGQSTDCP